MRRTTRTAAGALALAVAFGVGSPVAAAAGEAGHAKPAHVKVAKGDKALKGKKGAQHLRQVVRAVARTDARLARLEGRSARAGEHATTVGANITADRAALADLAAAVQAADSTHDLRAVRKALKDVRPDNYVRVINDLRRALELAAEITAARTALEGDLSSPVAELDAAQAGLDAAVVKALVITASSDKGDHRAVKADLETAEETFELVRAYLESLVVEDESTGDESTGDESTGDELTGDESTGDEVVVDPVLG